jgi:hypothetical protein
MGTYVTDHNPRTRLVRTNGVLTVDPGIEGIIPAEVFDSRADDGEDTHLLGPRAEYDFSQARPNPYASPDRRALSCGLANKPAFKEMFVKRRKGSPHEEKLVDGRAKCPVCGWLDEADPAVPEIRHWHGDTATGGGV